MEAPGDELTTRRLANLDAPHLVALEAWRRRLAERVGPVPHFDPFDGGAEARCLLLLETPGPRAAAIRFVSRDNPTATARNIVRFCEAAGLPRHDMVIWNTVPWLIHADGARNRPPRRSEVADGLALLPEVLALLPKLAVAVLAGRAAGGAQPLLRSLRPEIAVLRMPHPSPVYVNTAPHIAPGIVATLREAAGRLDRRGASAAQGRDGTTPGGSGAKSGSSS